LLIGNSPFLDACGGVAFSQVAAFHGHAVQPVRQAGELRATKLDYRHQFHPCCLQPFLVLSEAAAALGGCVAKLLQLLAGAGLAGANAVLDLALGRRFALDLDAWRHPCQTEIPLDLSHDGFLPFVVLTVADYPARVGDPVRQDVDVLVFGVGVPGDQELVVLEAHPA
jgi:hypothetical protein